MIKQPPPPRGIDELAEYLLKHGASEAVVDAVCRHRDEYPYGKNVPEELAYVLSQPPIGLTQANLGKMWNVSHQAVGLKIKKRKAELAGGEDWRNELPREWGVIRRPWRDNDTDRYLQALIMQRLHEQGRGPAPDKVTLAQARRHAEKLTTVGHTGAVWFYRQPSADDQGRHGYLLRLRRPDDDPNLIYVPE